MFGRLVGVWGYAVSVVAELDGAGSGQTQELFRRTYCGPPPQLVVPTAGRNRHYAERVARQRRVLNIITYLAAVVSASFAVMQLVTERGIWYVGLINVVMAVIFATIPLLHRFGPLVAPLTLITMTYLSLTVVCWSVGTASGLQFYFVVVAAVAVLMLGIDHIVLASVLVAIGVALVITLQFMVPADTHVQPEWSVTVGFVVSIVSACIMAVAAVSYALREIERAEGAMESEYERSETLLANILPSSIASRLKDSSPRIIADRYADASVLFADIAGYTERASDIPPADLVEFLNRLYTDFDRLVDRHGLEKIKTSGDCYIVVSGVPQPRHDHLEALACLALKMAEAVDGLIDPRGRAVPLRIGIGAGPVVAGVVGSRRFFYDVWGDAVNVASRMESTGVEGRIQVPHAVSERLMSEFVLEERGEVPVKGKGIMRTWFLVKQRDEPGGTRDQHLASSSV
jgi:adenylate cyclase